MKPVSKADRRVTNLQTGTFQTFLTDGQPDGEVLQANPNNPPGYGFHVYRMGPGEVTVPHRHEGDEEFFLIEGDLTDHDGYEYRPGDLVWLRDGTEHCSTSKGGCVLVVHLPGDAPVGS